MVVQRKSDSKMILVFFVQHFGLNLIRGNIPTLVFCSVLLFSFTTRAAINQTEEYSAQVPKTIIDLQQFRKTSSISISKSPEGEGWATLINLNPAINDWYLLLIGHSKGDPVEAYHLENPAPENQSLLLDPDFPEGLVIRSSDKAQRCILWGSSSDSGLHKATGTGKSYAPLCEERLLLRNKTMGHKTTMEKVTDLLRRHVWQGEKITTFVREKFYQDAYLNTSEIIKAQKSAARAERERRALRRSH